MEKEKIEKVLQSSLGSIKLASEYLNIPHMKLRKLIKSYNIKVLSDKEYLSKQLKLTNPVEIENECEHSPSYTLSKALNIIYSIVSDKWRQGKHWKHFKNWLISNTSEQFVISLSLIPRNNHVALMSLFNEYKATQVKEDSIYESVGYEIYNNLIDTPFQKNAFPNHLVMANKIKQFLTKYKENTLTYMWKTDGINEIINEFKTTVYELN